MPVCEGCGAAYDDQFQFCPHCGRAKPQPPTVRVEVQEARPKNACPICDRVDQVRKVTAIYAADTSHSETSGSSVTTGSSSGSGEYRNRDGQYIGSASSSGSSFSVAEMSASGIAQSDLAKAVAPPVKPAEPVLKKHGFPLWFEDKGMSWLIGITMIVGIGLGVMTSSMVGCIVTPIVVMILVMFLTSTVENSIYKDANDAEKAKFDQQTAEYPKRVAAWEAAMRKWNSLYYCYRDDVVFGPGSEDHAPPSQTVAFCYRRK